MDEKFNIGEYVADLQKCWKGMAGMCIATFFIAIIYIFLLKWLTKPLLYVSMVLILVFLILLGGWAWMKKAEYDPELQKKNYQYAMAGAIVSWIIAFIYLCFICCCWKNIALGASIMEAASDFVSSNLRIVFLPVISYVASLVFMLFWIFTATHLYSVGEPEFQAGLPIANIVWDDKIRYAMWLFFFGLFWVIAFLICMQ